MARSRVVVVTGASGGVGRAVARQLGARGDRVGLLARGEAGLAGAADDVRAAGGEALTLPADVADFAAVDAAAQAVEDKFGPIDVWVNVAFSSVFAPFMEIEPEEYRRAPEGAEPGYAPRNPAAPAPQLPPDPGGVGP